MQTSPNARPPRLGLIRFSLLAGALMFGAVVYFTRSQGNVPPAPPADVVQRLRYVGYAIWIGAMLGALIVKLRFADRIERGDQNILVIGWSMAELTAVFGGVYYQLVGDYMLWIAGIIAMVLSFTLFPVPRNR